MEQGEEGSMPSPPLALHSPQPPPFQPSLPTPSPPSNPPVNLTHTAVPFSPSPLRASPNPRPSRLYTASHHTPLPHIHTSKPPSYPSSPPSSKKPQLSKKLSMRSFLWTKPQDLPGHLEFASSLYSQLLPVLAVQLGSLSVGLGIAFPTVLSHQLGDELNHLSHSIGYSNYSHPSNSSGFSDFSDLSDLSARLRLTNAWDATGWTGPLYLLGMSLGGFLSSLLSSRLGRTSTLLVSSVTDILGWALVCLSPLLPHTDTLTLLMISRTLAGMAAASYLSNIQIYVAETVEPEHRGWMAGLSLPVASIGMMGMYMLGSSPSLSPHTPLVCLAPPVLLTILLTSLLWDTPYSYFMQGREKEAHSAMERLRRGEPASIGEVFRVQESVDSGRIEGGTLARLYLLATQKKYYSPFFILNALLIIILFTGVTTILPYASELYKRAGEHMSSYLSDIVIGILHLLGSCIFLPLVKLYSRKLLIVSSGLAMSLSLALLGLYLYSQTRYDGVFLSISLTAWIPIVTFSVFIVSAPIGLCSIPLLYTAELFPTEVRSLLSGLTISLTSLAALTLHLVFPRLELSLLPHGTVWLSSGACVAAILFCLSCIPETRHKELGQIPGKFAQWRKESRASPWVTPVASPSHTPSHSRCASPVRDLKRNMFTV